MAIGKFSRKRKLKGVNSLRKKLRKIEPAARRTMKAQTLIVARHALQGMKRNVRNKVYSTGRLHNALTMKIDKDGIGGTIGLRTVTARKRGYYGIFFETGTVFMNARPWFQPAWNATLAKFKDKVPDILTREIHKIATRGIRGKGR